MLPKPPNDFTHVYIFPWYYKAWMHQIPLLHIGRLHICFHRMGRSYKNGFWLPNLSFTWKRRKHATQEEAR